MTVLGVVALVFAVLGVVLLGWTVVLVRRRRLLRGLLAALAGLLGLALAALCACVTIGVRGYRALTDEVTAAWVRTEPLAPQQFRAVVRLPDEHVGAFVIDGDALYVDAHILKWKPIVNILGLHTAYVLDRVGGRYNAIADEQQKTHTVFPLGPDRPIDLFAFVRRHPRILAPLVDATYGSGTFIGAEQPGRFQVRVSTSGLLIRPDSAGAQP